MIVGKSDPVSDCLAVELETMALWFAVQLFEESLFECVTFLGISLTTAASPMAKDDEKSPAND